MTCGEGFQPLSGERHRLAERQGGPMFRARRKRLAVGTAESRAIPPSSARTRICLAGTGRFVLEERLEAFPDPMLLTIARVSNERVEEPQQPAHFDLPRPPHPGAVAFGLKDQFAGDLDSSQARARSQAAGTLVVSDLEDHRDRSPHRPEGRPEAAPLADGFARFERARHHLTVEPGLVPLVGHEVEHLRGWTTDQDVTVDTGHVQPPGRSSTVTRRAAARPATAAGFRGRCRHRRTGRAGTRRASARRR